MHTIQCRYVMKARAVSSHPAPLLPGCESSFHLAHPCCLPYLPSSHLPALCIIRMTVTASQCLSLSHPVLLNNGPQAQKLEEEMATRSSILAWKIPWTEEPLRLQSIGCKGLDTTEWLTHKHQSSDAGCQNTPERSWQVLPLSEEVKVNLIRNGKLSVYWGAEIYRKDEAFIHEIMKKIRVFCRISSCKTYRYVVSD